jgi:quinol monooxygenase YgiN
MASKVTKALLVRFEAIEGKGDEVAAFLDQGLALTREEPATARWFGLRFGRTSFGIFDAFPDEEGRRAHLAGPVAEALMANVGRLFEAPTIEEVDVLAEKDPV